MDPQALVLEARRCEAEKRFPDAVVAWLAVAKISPGEPHAYARLFDLHAHTREVDAAFCAASVLASLDALEGMAKELYEDYCPRRLPRRTASMRLAPEDWADLRHRLEEPTFDTWLAPARDKLRLPDPASDAVDAPSYAWACDLLGVGVGDLPPDGAPVVAADADRDEVWRNMMLRERLFFAGRAATALAIPSHRLLRVPSKQIAAAIADDDMERLELWQATVGLTRARAGMLACGEPAVARAILVREGASDIELAELSLFAVSPAHHRVRRKVGIAIGAMEDAP